MSTTQEDQFRRAAKDLVDTRPTWQKLGQWFLGVPREVPPPTAEPALEPTPGRIGVCCSGGGLRSAAYNLGALQALRKQDVLGKVDYLTAVSGGSYIAAAHFITAASSDPRLFTRVPVFGRSSPEEQYLRSHTDYLAPGLGGKVGLVVRLLAGLSITAVLLMLSLEVASRLLGWAYGEWLQLRDGGRNSQTLHVTASVWAPVASLAVAAVTSLVIRLLFRLPDAAARFLAAWGFRAMFAAVVIFVVLIGLPYMVVALRHLPTAGRGVERLSSLIQEFRTNATLQGLAGLGSFLSIGFGAFRALVAKRRSWIAMLVGGLIAPIALLVYFLVRLNAIALEGFTWPQVVTVLVVLVVLAFVYWQADLTQWSMHPSYRERLSSAFALRRLDAGHPAAPSKASLRPMVGAVVGPLLSAVIVAVGLSGWQPAAAWSTSLLLLAVPVGLIVGQRLTPKRPGFAMRAVDPEVDPDPGTDPKMFAEEVPFERRLPLPAMNPPAVQLGLPRQLVVCAAANVSDRGSTPTGRGGASFTFDAAQIGGPVVGFVQTAAFERAVGYRARDLTLPAAVAMSGAAISPSMGKMTRRPLTFLLALANVRLGVWLPNPRKIEQHARETETVKAGSDTVGGNGRSRMATIGQKVIGLTPRAHYLVKELLGRNHLSDKYLYVTDGGHYENLGLVELLRRGCTTIYCFDAAGDHVDTFNTLGSAIELARVDLNVEVQLDPATKLLPVEEAVKASRWSRVPLKLSPNDHLVGDIVYHRPDGSTIRGAIVYAKAAVVADAPWDVRAFQQRHPVFPNHSTALQLFDEATFEAYRALGEFTARRATNSLASYLAKQELEAASHHGSPDGAASSRVILGFARRLRSAIASRGSYPSLTSLSNGPRAARSGRQHPRNEMDAQQSAEVLTPPKRTGGTW